MNINDVLAQLAKVNDKRAEQMVAKLPDYVKDKIYKMIVTPDYYKIISKGKNYKEVRDKAISAKLWMFKTREELDNKFTNEGYTGGTVQRFVDLLEKKTSAVQFSENVKKGMKENYPEQYAELLSLAGDYDLDTTQLRYVGDSRYIYRNKYMIHFEYSPQYIWVEQLY